MFHKILPFMYILVMLFVVVPLCGCNGGLKRFVKNELGHGDDTYADTGSSSDNFFDDVGSDDGAKKEESEAVDKSVSSSETSKSKTKTFGRRKYMTRVNVEDADVTRSRNIALVQSKEDIKLKTDNKEPQITNVARSVVVDSKKHILTATTNPVFASNRHHNISTSNGIEYKINGLVKHMAAAVPATEKLKISIVEFSNFHDETTDFTTYLYEELVTSFSSNSKFEVVDSVNRIGKQSKEIDAIVTGSIMNLDDSVKVNARLMLNKTGMIVTAVSTSLQKNKVIERLMETKHDIHKVEAGNGDLYSRIDDLARQIVSCLQQSKKYKLVLLEFTDLNGRANTFSQFLSQELVTRLFLANTNRIEIVDNNIVLEFIKANHISLQQLAYPEFSKKLAESLGVNSIVKGVITDLGNSIKLNARIITAETGAIFGVAAVDIVKDEKLSKLLNEKPRVKSSVTKKITTKNEIKKELGSVGSTGNGIFFKEDFSRYDDGQPLGEWGEGLVVRKDEDDKSFLTSAIDDFSVAKRELQFPGEFSFEFDVKGSTKYWSSIRFRDAEGSVFSVSFRLFQNILSVTFPGPKQVKTDIDINKYCKIKIVRKNKLYELHTNGSLLIVGSYSKYKPFNSFEIHSAFNRFQFTGFIGNDLVEK